MNSFEELYKKLSQDIDTKDTRARARTEQEQIRFDYAVSYILKELWNKHFTHEDNETSIQKNKNFYSALEQYRDPNLTYRMAIQALSHLEYALQSNNYHHDSTNDLLHICFSYCFTP